MENLGLDYFISQGVFAVLFVWLLIDTKKDSKAREKELHSIITKLSDKFSIVQNIQSDVEDIKDELKNKI